MKKRSISIALIACMLLGSTMSACGSAEAKTNESKTADNNDAKPKITLTMSIDEKTTLDENNYALNWVKENSGVDIDFNMLPSTDTETKLNLMLSSGDYSDVIVNTLKRQRVFELGMKEGIFIPINDLYEKYGDNLKKVISNNPDYYKRSLAPDGNMYGFLNSNECYHCQAYPKTWFNKKWLEKLGMSEPQTTEELYNVLKAAKNSDYNGNGTADEIPFTGNIDWDCQPEYWLLNSFLPVDKKSFAYAKDGTVMLSASQSEYRDGLRYLKKLFDEGLIDPSSFTQKNDQMQQVIRSDENLVFAYTADHMAIGVDLNNYDVNAQTFAMVPVEGPTGARYQPHNALTEMTADFSWFITDKCKDPETAFKLGDFMLSEEAYFVKTLGEKGKYWDEYPADKDVESVLGGKAKYWTNPSYSSDAESDFYKNIFHSQPLLGTAEFRDSYMAKPEDEFVPEAYEARLTLETKKLMEYFYKEYLPREPDMTDEDNTRFLELRTPLTDFIKSSTTAFITGEQDIEKDWDTYVTQLDQYGAKEYLDLYQKAYTEYLKD